MTLAEFLDRARKTPFRWGEFDCVLWLADWALARGLRDPAAPYRGRYSTPLGAARIIRRAGGLAELIDQTFGRLGWQRISVAKAGDIGLIETNTDAGLAPTGAIFNGRLWALLPRGGGLMLAPAEPLFVWSPA